MTYPQTSMQSNHILVEAFVHAAQAAPAGFEKVFSLHRVYGLGFMGVGFRVCINTKSFVYTGHGV